MQSNLSASYRLDWDYSTAKGAFAGTRMQLYILD